MEVKPPSESNYQPGEQNDSSINTGWHRIQKDCLRCYMKNLTKMGILAQQGLDGSGIFVFKKEHR